MIPKAHIDFPLPELDPVPPLEQFDVPLPFEFYQHPNVSDQRFFFFNCCEGSFFGGSFGSDVIDINVYYTNDPFNIGDEFRYLNNGNLR